MHERPPTARQAAAATATAAPTTTEAESIDRQDRGAGVPWDPDVYIAALLSKVRELRCLDPGGDWAARIYHCPGCGAFNFTAAPIDELPDDYPCPGCGAGQVPVVPATVPSGPPRGLWRPRR